jgi:multidrug efflux pump subunit AcrA (membrane-fusion protein)
MSARPVRGRTMVLAGVGALAVFLILLTVGVVPRLRNSRELAGAAEQLRTTPLNVYVVRPERASVAGLTLAATTQAIQDSVIYARISGYLVRRYVDIGDRVTAGQLLAEVDSPEVDEQLRQARAELQQSEKALDLQRANLELARTTAARYEAADAEGAVAKQAVDQSVAMLRTAQASVAAAEANVMAYKANVQRLLALTSFQRHGDPAQRRRGRVDHRRQPGEQHRGGADDRHRRCEWPVRGGPDRHAARLRHCPPGLREERGGWNAGSGEDSGRAHGTGEGHGDPHQ